MDAGRQLLVPALPALCSSLLPISQAGLDLRREREKDCYDSNHIHCICDREDSVGLQ